ncbi:MAG TPA: hypothetical protein DCQ51_05340 [Planktothrix sp. UBA8407]|nr:hypothetical protein [Planktothrix sp. UBA8407]
MFKALGGVKTELTPEQLRLAWTDVDTQVDQLCNQTVSPLKQQIEQQSNEDITYKTIVDLFNQIGVNCNKINLDTDRLKANNQQSSEPQQTVDSPETNIKQELQKIQQLLNQVKEWVSQEQEKKYREGLEKRLDSQQNLLYSILGLLLGLLLGLFITVVLYKKGDRTVDGADQDQLSDGTKNKQTFVGQKESEALSKMLQDFDDFLKKQTQALSNVEIKLQKTLLKEEIEQLITKKIDDNNNQIKGFFQISLEKSSNILEKSITKQIEKISINAGDSQQEYSDDHIKEINQQLAKNPDFIKDQVDQSFNSFMETKFIPFINQQYEDQKLNLIANLHELVPTVEDDKSNSQELNNEQIQELRSQLEQITEELEKSKSIIQKLESEQSKLTTNIEQLNTTLQTEQETIHQLQSDLQEKKDDLETSKKEIKIRDDRIDILEFENRNAKQKNKAEETTNTQNETQRISKELQNLVDQYNQNKGDLKVLNVSFTPVKDDSEQVSRKIKVKKTNESDAKFYIISCRQELCLFPKLKIMSSVDIKGLKRYFDCPTLTDSTIDIQLVTPAKMKQISGTEDSWELFDQYSKGKVT